MPWIKPAVWTLALVFGAFSAWVLLEIGYFGIWRGGFANLGSTQITFDLVVACTIAMGFVARDCHARGRPWWPWALLTAVGGSLGLLAYVLFGRGPSRRSANAALPAQGPGATPPAGRG